MLFLVIFVCTLCLNIAGAPWWMMVPLCMLASFFLARKQENAFVTGFLSNGSVWALLLVQQVVTSNTILAERAARFLGLPHWLMLIVITILIGAILGGLSTYLGKRIRKDYNHYILKKNNF